MMSWQAKAMIEASNDAANPARPFWTDLHVPNCADDCPYHDGKRCELLGSRPDTICEPVVKEMANMLSVHAPKDLGKIKRC